MPILHSATDVIVAFEAFGVNYKRARACGVKEVKIPDTFYTHHFSQDYTFHNWIEDSRADEDLITLLKSVFGTVPYVAEIFDAYQREYDRPLTINYQNRPCIGLGLASDKIFDSVAFSFYHSDWELHNYTVSITSIVEGDNGELLEITENCNAKNISTIEHVLIHQEFINGKVAPTIQNGRELWHRRAELFPNLEFCASVKSQMENLTANNLQFQQIIERLFDLQNTAIDFNGNPIQPNDFPTKTSKESVSRERDLSDKLTIMCPDGSYRLFSWHSRYTPGAGRIHFFPFENHNHILVGYIGKKIQ